MGTWYIDPESGSDLNGGSSWSALITSTDGVANGTTTFTSATGGFTGKENHWMWVQTKNVRRKIVTVDSDTSVTLSGTVVAGTGLTFIVGGALVSTSASGIAISAGDVIKLPKSKDQAVLGTATWTNGSPTVTLAEAKTLRIDETSFPWWPSTNVTSATYANKKAHDVMNSLVIAAGFTTGKIAYQKLYELYSGGTASASSTYSGLSANSAFDNKSSTYWTNNNALPAWIKYDFGSGVQKTWVSYGVVGGSQLNYDPKTWKLQGSNNDTDWDDLDSQTGITLTNRQCINWYTIASPAAYRYYRLYVTVTYSGGNYVSMQQLVFTEGAHDYSSMEQITFWTYGSVGYSSGVFQIKLCSDDTGDTAVDTFTLGGCYSNARPNTIDKGSALGSSIKSVALYAVSDPSTITMYLNSLHAAKAASSDDCLTYTSLISASATGMQFGIDSIDGVTLKIAEKLSTWATYVAYFPYTTTTCTSYVIQCVQDNGSVIRVIDYSTNCTAINRGEISGGWNKTSDLQDGVTWLSSQYKYPLIPADYVDVEKIGIRGGDYAVYVTGKYCTLQIEGITAATVGVHLNGSGAYGNTLTFGHINAESGIYTYNGARDNTITAQDILTPLKTSTEGIRLYSATYDTTVTVNDIFNATYNIYCTQCSNNTINVRNMANCGTYHVYLPDARSITINCSGTCTAHRGNYDFGLTSTSLGCSDNIINNANVVAGVSGAYTIWTAGGACRNVFNNLTSSGHLTGVVGFSDVFAGSIHINGYNGSEAICTAAMIAHANFYPHNAVVSCDKYGGDTSDNRRYTYGCTYKSQTTTRHTASGVAWQILPVIEFTASRPVRLPIFTGYLTSGITYTISAYMYRDNAGISAGIYANGWQLQGITSSKSDMLSLTGEWEQLSFDITPTESGVVTVEAIAYGGTTYNAYVDDVTVTES